MLLFYIRHGQPIYDPDSLTPLGKRQAEALGKRLARFGIDEIYASTSTRAIQTAEPTAEMTGKPIVQLDWCNEAHAWEELTVWNEKVKGRTWLYQSDEMRMKMVDPQIAALGNRWYTHEWFADPRYEKGVKRVAKETYAFLERLGYRYSDKTNTYEGFVANDKRIALFAHEGFGMVFLSTLLNIPYPQFCTHFGLGHSSMTVIRFAGEENVIPCVLQLSNDSHCYREGLPTKYNDEIYI